LLVWIQLGSFVLHVDCLEVVVVRSLLVRKKVSRGERDRTYL
jgi:hypothetical protein